MEKRELRLILLGLLLIAGTPIAAQQKSVFISGRAVDEQGAAISDAIVTLYFPPCRGCIDHNLPVFVSFPDGAFFIDHTDVSVKRLTLFIREPLPKGFWSPLGAPPFDHLSHLPQFKGIAIRPRKGKVRVDLGDVLVRIRYGKVTIDLPKVLADQFKPGKDVLKSLHATVRDSSGKVIYSGPLPEEAFNPTFSSVNFALTKGMWRLALSVNDQPVRRTVHISANVTPSDCIKLTLNNGKTRSQPCVQ